MAQEKEYYAFISYQRKDTEWADRLRKKLEHYRLPSNVRKQDASLPKEIRPIFRDSLELAGGVLAKEIETALQQSKYLIVICSPNSAKSPWVNREIQTFIDLGREDRIIPFIIDGTPFSGNEEKECFPPALLSLKGEKELLGISINELSRDAASIKVVARMFGLKFDSLWQRYEREQRNRKIWISFTTIIAFLCVSGIAYWMYWQNQQTQKANWKMMENQARFVAEKASTLVDEGDTYLARLLLVEVLPDSNSKIKRPYTPEAENAFRKALLHNSTILRGHTDRVNSASFSPDSQFVVSASDDKTIRIWDTTTGKQIGQPLKGHTGYVNSAVFSPDGKHIVSASHDKTVRIWNPITGKQIGQPLEGHDSYVHIALFSPDGKRIISASDDKTIRIWDAITGKQIGQPLKGHTGWVRKVAFSPDGNRIVSSSHDNTVRIWDADTGKQIGQPLVGHTDIVGSVAFSPDGKRIVSVFQGVINSYRSSDGKVNRTNSNDKTIRIWDANSCKQIGQPIEVTTNWPHSVSFSHDGKYIVLTNIDGYYEIWDVESRRLIYNSSENTQKKHTISDNLDFCRFWLLPYGENVKILNTFTKYNYELTIEKHTEYINSAAFSPDGKRIVSASNDGTVRIWNANTGKQIGQPLRGHTDYVKTVAFSPDGKRIVSASSDGTVRIWNANTGKQIGQPLEGHASCVLSAAFRPDGNRIVSASDDGTVRIWDTTTGKQIGQPLKGHTGYVNSAVFSPDGKCIVSASADRTIRIWDANSGKQIGQPLENHKYSVSSAVFSPDGKFIASTDFTTINIWDANSGKQIGRPLKGHTYSVNSVAFSRDGKYIVSASDDKTIRVWDATTGIQIGQTLEGHTDDVTSASFNLDDNRIVSSSYDGTIKIWDFPSLQKLINETRERFKIRKLTFDEKRKYYLE